MAPETPAARTGDAILEHELETLQQVATQLITASGTKALYDRILDSAMKIVNAEFASIQMLQPRGATRELKLLGHRGFNAEAEKEWEWVGAGKPSTCGQALVIGKRVAVFDIHTCEFMAGTKEMETYAAAGIRSVQSAPLLSRSGAVLGMLSTHWRQPHELSISETRGLDILARLAAEVIERANADEALWENQQRLASIYDAVRDVIFRVAIEPNGELRFVSVNAALLRNTGMTREQMLGKTLAEVVPEASYENVLAKYRQVIEEKTTVIFEETGDFPTGRLTGNISLTPVLDKSSSCTHIIGVVHDITERKKAEIALQESEEHFRNIADAVPAMVWVTGPEPGCTFVNKRWLEFTGHSLEEELGSGWASALHPEDREWRIANMKEAFAAKRGFRVECRFRRADGQYRWIVDIAIPTFRDGRFSGFIGSCLDITDLKCNQERLRAIEARLLNALRLAQLGSWVRDEETGIAELSDDMLRILGYPEPPPLTMAAFLNMVHPEDREYVRNKSASVRATGEVDTGEYRIIRTDGEVRYVRIVIEPMLNERGVVTCVVGTTQDITDFKRTQDESFARQKLESVGTLASGIAHDFNNILGGVLAQADLALADLAAGASPENELKAIRNAAVRGSQVVRELMIYAGKDRQTPELADVSQAVKEMLEMLRVSVSNHAVLEIDLGPKLPPVAANAAQIQQILMNLVVNSSEALGDKEGLIRVVTSYQRIDASDSHDGIDPGDYIELEVSDTGCGMSSQTRARIFDPFFTTKAAGHGLGLVVVNGIVRALNGKILLETSEGAGSTFRVLLPCDTANRPLNPVAAVGEVATSSVSGTVLFLEDEDILRTAVGKVLRKNRFKVFEASNGLAAIEVLRSNGAHIDLLLLDVTFQGPSIHEVIAEYVKARPRPKKMILTSAYSEEMVRTMIDEARICGFIRKPFHLSDLVRTLREALRQ